MQQLPNEPTDDDVTRFAEKFVDEHQNFQSRIKSLPKFEIYKASDGWRWRLRANNGKIIADSAEGYKRKGKCKEGIDLVKVSAAAEVVEVEG
jgi:uncharacterized protein YegP (UPF0339 family)